MLLQGSAYISGGASGIGCATAFAFAQYGIKSLALSDQNEKALHEVRQELEVKHPHVNVTCYKIDLSNEASVVETLSRVFNDLGRVNYAVNNAGIAGPSKGSVDVLTNEFLHVLDVNLTGLWISEREELKYMLKQEPVEENTYGKSRGVIVNTASIAGLFAGENIAPYIASKHGVVGITRGDAATYAKDHIRINCVCPGFIKTPMLLSSEEELAAIANKVPMKRVAAPEEVASAIVFLASPLSSYVSGTALVVDGGFSTV